MPIPGFDHNGVLPAYLSSPTDLSMTSPYSCTTLELCDMFGKRPARKALLGKFLNFRARFENEGVTDGFQWLDGSFLEDVESLEQRSPSDIDVVTIYWGYKADFLRQVLTRFPEIGDRALSKQNYSVDHFAVNGSLSPRLSFKHAAYWAGLFSHTRLGVRKGMLKIELNTPDEDRQAQTLLEA